MNLYPQDLGANWYVALVRRRALTQAGADSSAALAAMMTEPPPPRRGLLRRVWAYGLEPAEEAAEAAIAGLMIGKTRGAATTGGFMATLFLAITLASHSVDVSFSAFFLLWAGFSGTTQIILPRMLFQRLHRKPLTVAEVESLVALAKDDLELTFLALAVDVIRQKVPAETAQDLRNALRSLGEAIARLPNVPPMPENADALREEALIVRSRAHIEQDPVVTASLNRQADALERLAQVVDYSARLVRRSAALREELTAQARALRGGLTACGIGGTDTRLLTHLAEAVRQVAVEAASVGAARDELEGVAAAAHNEERPQAHLRQGQR